MHTSFHTAIVAVGNIAEIYILHEQVRRLLWDQGPDYVRLLSPICNSLAGRLASFAIMPHGFDGPTQEGRTASLLLEQASILIGMADCQFIHIGFGGPGPSPEILGQSV